METFLHFNAFFNKIHLNKMALFIYGQNSFPVFIKHRFSLNGFIPNLIILQINLFYKYPIFR